MTQVIDFMNKICNYKNDLDELMVRTKLQMTQVIDFMNKICNYKNDLDELM
jgi:uncharacterized protein with HEPN domain